MSAAIEVAGGDVGVDIWRSALTALRPPPDITVHEWAEQKRVFRQGPEPGRWHSRPFQIEPMEAISDDDVDGVVYVGVSQGGGKSEIILNTIGYYTDADPSEILYVGPDLETAEAFSKDRVAPMYAACPDLRDKVRDPRSRDSGNTIRHKQFDGGALTLVGANSASGLSMRPKRVLTVDEIGRFKDSAGTEGDAIKLADARLLAYDRLGLSKRVYVSSPATKKTDRLWRLWQQTDQCEWHVDCYDCGQEQFLKWSQVLWDKDQDGVGVPETAYYSCEHCGARWNDHERFAAAEAGRYRPTAKTKRRMRGFRVNCLAITGIPLSKWVEEWLDAQGNPEEVKVFINTRRTEWWEEKGESLDENSFLKEGRREDFGSLCPPKTEVPPEVSLLTIGVDFQKSPPRVEYEIVGWGRGEESWSLKYDVIHGDIRTDPNVFNELEEILLTPLTHAKGFPMYIRAACLDSGWATNQVYQFCRPRLRRPLPNGQSQFVFAIKGRSEIGRPTWPEIPSKRRKQGVGGRINLWIIGTDATYDMTVGRLALTDPGPGYCHYDLTRGKAYFEGLTSMHQVPRKHGRSTRLAWERKKVGQANEPIVCRNYAYAACVGIQAEPFLFDMGAECDRVDDLPYVAVGEGGPTAPSSPPRRTRRARSRGVES